MYWLALKDSRSVKTNLFLSTHNINEENITVCFDDITKGTTTFKVVPKKEFESKFEVLSCVA